MGQQPGWEHWLQGRAPLGPRAVPGSDRQRPRQGPKQGQGKVLRGGSWNYAADSCRSASRTYATVTNWGADFVGFRVACEVRR